MRLVTDNSNAAMKQFLTDLFDAYLAPTGIQRGSYTCGYGCSDHASWTSAGFPAAMMFEGGSSGGGYNPNIHSPNDTLANMGDSAAPSVHFARLGLAFLGELGKTAGGGGNAAPVANFNSSVNGLTASFTDTSTDSDGSIVARSWNFGDGATSTATNPGRTYAAAGTYNVSLTVTDDDGATHARTAPVTVTNPPSGGGVLTNGVARTGLSGAAGSSQYFTLSVPAGATGLRFVTSGGTGDLDLYARFGAQPTTTVNDCKSAGSSNTETCSITTAQAGTYHVLVRGYSAYSGASLTGSYGAGGGGAQTYGNTTDYAINDNATVDSPINVSGRAGNGPASASISVNIVHTYKGDLKVDLVAPDGTLYNLHNRSGGSADNVVGTFSRNLTSEVLNGTWKLRVNDNASGDVGYINSWNVTF